MANPKPRLQVDDGLTPPKSQVVARPIDTFVQQNAGAQVEQLARALATIAPGLARFGDVLFQKKVASDNVEGAKQARETVRKLDESRTSFADAVKNGQIPAHMNPWMKQSYYEEVGRLYANRLNSDLLSAIDMDENLKNSVELKDFRSFTADFEKKFLAENVPEDLRNQAFEVGYGNRRDQAIANLEAGWSAQTEQRFTHRTLTMFKDEAIQYVQDALDHEQSPQQIGAFLRQMWDDKHSIGWDGQLTGNAVVDAVADVALDRKDPELAREILAHVRGGDGKSANATLAKTDYAIKALAQNDENIGSTQRRQWERQDRERTETDRSITGEAAKRFTDALAKGTDPDDVRVDDLQAQAASHSLPNTVLNLTTMKEAYSNREYDDDNDLVADISVRINRYGPNKPGGITQAELNQRLREKRLSLPTYNNLTNQLQESLRTKKAVLEDDEDFKYGAKVVQAYFGSSPDADTPEVATRKQQALRQFSSWYMNNFVSETAPNRSTVGFDKRQMIDAMAQDLARVWVPYDDNFSGTFRLTGQDFDWRVRPLDIEERLTPALDELESFLDRSSQSPPSPALMSLLTVYRVNLTDEKELREFLDTQRKLLTQVTPTTNASAKPKK